MISNCQLPIANFVIADLQLPIGQLKDF